MEDDADDNTMLSLVAAALPCGSWEAARLAGAHGSEVYRRPSSNWSQQPDSTWRNSERKKKRNMGNEVGGRVEPSL